MSHYSVNIMALNLVKLSTSFLLLLLINPFLIVDSRAIKPSKDPFIKTLQNLKGVQKGQTLKGIGELKNYLTKFGYLNVHHDATLSNDHFDENLELALKDFQTYYHLNVTGHVDTTTIEIMSLPRCGVPDFPKQSHKLNKLMTVSKYALFPGSLKWRDSKRNLNYMYKSSVDVVSMDIVRQACESAFLSWSEVTDFTFREVGVVTTADIIIGFHRGDHGDGISFEPQYEGSDIVLAHSFSPEDGRLHFNGDKQWTNSLSKLKDNSSSQTDMTKRYYDLETVALHEMGHLLGLEHSRDHDAIMFANYLGVRRNLKQDDVDGILALYVLNN